MKVEITFLGYKTITKIHSMREPVELGELVLLEDTKVLGEVLVQGVSVVGEQKGDTTNESNLPAHPSNLSTLEEEV